MQPARGRIQTRLFFDKKINSEKLEKKILKSSTRQSSENIF
jgi:hypothetical protein